jgi:hypothetical protein
MKKFLVTLTLMLALAISVFAQRINVVQTDPDITYNVTASSAMSGFPVVSAVNGDTSGVGWGTGQAKNGGWNSLFGTSATYNLPFSRPYLFDEVVVYGASNSLASTPREAYEGETTSYANHKFDLQASEDCLTYSTVASVSGNNLVINHLGFQTPVYAMCLRLVFDTSASVGGDGYARVVEIKAYARQ